jgi:hypothetical protein
VGAQVSAAVASDADGDFVVVWSSEGQDGSSYGIFGQRFDSSGAPQAAEFQVNSYTPGAQTDPVIGAAPDGAFVVSWASSGQDGSDEGVFARRFDATGAPLATEFQVNSFTSGPQSEPAVATDNGGDFVIAWQSEGQDGDDTAVIARRFDSSGQAEGPEVPVNSWFTGSQHSASVAAADAAGFVVTWTSNNQDGDDLGIFGQRYASGEALTLDIDGDGTVMALTDGLLLLRSGFGFIGPSLVSGATSGTCTRCDGPAVQSQITAVLGALDVDLDGTAQNPLTDSLLVARFLFGFIGPSF